MPQCNSWLFFKNLTNITTFHYHISSFIYIWSLSSISWDTKFDEIIIFFTVFLIVLASSSRLFEMLTLGEYIGFHSLKSFPFFHLYISLKMRSNFIFFTKIICFYCFYPFSSLKNWIVIIIFGSITLNNNLFW